MGITLYYKNGDLTWNIWDNSHELSIEAHKKGLGEMMKRLGLKEITFPDKFASGHTIIQDYASGRI